MFIAILQHTPIWVWALLALLIAIGIAQSFPRSRTLGSATLVPVVMTVLSLQSAASGLSQKPVALAAWVAGAAAALAISNAVSAWDGIRWSEADRRLAVPGSWVPLALILGLFATKFSANVMLAMSPDFARDKLFAMLVCFACGAFSGIFIARGVVMWRVAKRFSQLRVAY